MTMPWEPNFEVVNRKIEVASRLPQTERIDMLENMLIIQMKNHQIERAQLEHQYEKQIHDLKFQKAQLEKILWDKKDATPWYHLAMFFRRGWHETRNKISRKYRNTLFKKS